MVVAPSEPRAQELASAIRAGDLGALRVLIASDPELARAQFGDRHEARSALHIATDWPGHFPNGGDVIRLLVEEGADVDARFVGTHRETPLHWAASSDDVEALDALLMADADIEADGGVLTDGPPLDDAVIFRQWNAARRLVECGANTKLFHAAALGLDARVTELLDQRPPTDEITNALWHACRAGVASTAELLMRAGGDPLWMGWEHLTPLAAARESGNDDLIAAMSRNT